MSRHIQANILLLLFDATNNMVEKALATQGRRARVLALEGFLRPSSRSGDGMLFLGKNR